MKKNLPSRIEGTLSLICLIVFIISGLLPVYAGASPTATLYVNPPSSSADIDSIVIVDIEVSDVNQLYGWEFKLRWDKDILEYLDIMEGGFLGEDGTYQTYFIPKIYNEQGYIYAADVLMGAPAFAAAKGSGILATITFQVIGKGSTNLDLYETMLLDYDQNEIKHNINNGVFNTEGIPTPIPTSTPTPTTTPTKSPTPTPTPSPTGTPTPTPTPTTTSTPTPTPTPTPTKPPDYSGYIVVIVILVVIGIIILAVKRRKS